jgi:peptidoglycan hydrolase-like protein with peptidoglycan-binding domain
MTAIETRFPGAKYVSISPYMTTGVDCLDIEPGNAGPSAAPAFVRSWIPVNTDKPVIYADGHDMPDIKTALSKAGIARSQYYLWLANPNGDSTVPAGYDAIQYQWTSGYDADSFNDYMFATPKSVWPLKQGSVNAQVTALQTLLNQLAPKIGLKKPIGVDGDFGAETLAAVELAQRRFGYAPPTVFGEVTEAYYTGLEHNASNKPPIVIPTSHDVCAPVTKLTITGEGPHSYRIQWEYPKQGKVPAGSFQIATSSGSHLGKEVPSYPRSVDFKYTGTYSGQYGGVNTKTTGYIIAVRTLAANGHQASEWTTVKLPKYV